MSKPAASKGRRLVVGGGRAGPIQVYDHDLDASLDLPGFPLLKPGDISLNLDPEAVPHVVGDINQAPFQDAAFKEVYFEKVPYESSTGPNLGAIKEAARVLEPGGRLVIEMGSGVPLEGYAPAGVPVHPGYRQRLPPHLRPAERTMK